MENIIIGIILIGMVALGVRGTAKHFRGEGGCCGGGASSVKRQKKRLVGKIVRTYLLSIDGMHCKNCANNIEGTINGFDGVVAKVNFGKNTAKICCDREIDIESIIAAVEERGYRVTACQGACSNETGL